MIGIDLGTTFSVVAVYKDDDVEIIPNEIDHRTTPSVVSYYNGGRVVGDSAVRLSTINPESTVFAVKRLIGRRFSEEDVQKEIRRVPYHIVEREDRPYIKIITDDDDLLISPEEVSGLVLKKLKSQAEAYLNETITEAVVTVPAYFNEEQRKATITAGNIAGLTIKRIISEPTAAALAYGLDKKNDSYVLVYDLGGGTFDASLLSMEDGVFEVKATGGDTRLGGEDFDESVVQLMVNRFMQKTGLDCSRDRVSLSRLKKACEGAKIRLSDTDTTSIDILNFFEGHDLHENLTKAEFIKVNQHLFDRTIKKIESVLRDANITKNEVDDIVMIGGSSRIPFVRELVSNYFGGKELCTSINPDEAVAVGAAIQAAIIGTDRVDLVVVDVYPLTLGVETHGGLMSPIIKRNSRIPIRRSKIYTTHSNDAAGARIEIFEGERPLTRDNRALGIFELHRLPRASRGQLQIKVTFEIDANAILHVSAQELTTKAMESIEIDTLDFALSESQVEEAIQNAEAFSEEDEADRRRVVARLDYENTLLDITSQLKAEKKNPMFGKAAYKEFKKKIKDATKWLDENPMEDPSVYEKRSEELRVEFGFLNHKGQLPDL